MPMFEFKCVECGEQFEELLLSSSDSVSCPKCKSDNVQRLLSAFASTVKSGGGSVASGCSAKPGSGFG